MIKKKKKSSLLRHKRKFKMKFNLSNRTDRKTLKKLASTKSFQRKAGFKV